MKKILLVTILLFISNQILHSNPCIHNSIEMNSMRDSIFDKCDQVEPMFFETNQEAENAVDKILNSIGLKRNFSLLPCPGFNNAAARTSKKGVRYIIYDNKFMESIGTNKRDWFSLGILAHEIGHHLNGHIINIAEDNIETLHKYELEADEFSGFVLCKLGANLEECQLAVQTLSNESDDTYSAHPTRSKRLEAVKKGFDNAKTPPPPPPPPPPPTKDAFSLPSDSLLNSSPEQTVISHDGNLNIAVYNLKGEIQQIADLYVSASEPQLYSFDNGETILNIPIRKVRDIQIDCRLVNQGRWIADWWNWNHKNAPIVDINYYWVINGVKITPSHVRIPPGVETANYSFYLKKNK